MTMENKENLAVIGNCVNLSDNMDYFQDTKERNSTSINRPSVKTGDNSGRCFLNKKDNSELESEYFSCSNNTSFNTTIYNEPSLSLSFILKDEKEKENPIESQISDLIPKYNSKNDIFSNSFKHVENNSLKKDSFILENSNANLKKSSSLSIKNYNIKTDVKSKGMEDELEFYKKRAESIFVKHSLHPYVKKFNNIPLEQKYEVCLLAWKNNHKSLAIEILESIIYDSGFRERNSNLTADVIIRQANKFLGFCYLTGDGIQKNVEKAVMYFKKSDTTDSLFLLGIIYFSGYIEKEDAAADNLRLAEKWFKMAAERGHLSSQIMLLYLMYMEEEQSINKQRERSIMIDESGLDELSFMFNDESLQKVSENVKRINHNILNNVNSDMNSNLLLNKRSSSSLNSTINNSPRSSSPLKTIWSNDTRSTSHTVVSGCGNGSDGKSSHYNPHYNYSFSSNSNVNPGLPHSVNKNDYFKLNHKLSMETINYSNPNNSSTHNLNNLRSTNATTGKYLINTYGGMKSSFDVATQTRHRNILYWLKKAANHKNVPPFIFFELGYYYQNGIGTEKNLKQATHWYQCLVDRETEYIKQYPWINNNILYAKYQLARLAPSASKSIDWLINAANDGNAMAQTCLGQYYFEQNSIQHKMQQYIVKHAKEFDSSSIFGKKLKSFDNIHVDNLQHMEGFQHFFNGLVENLYKQDQQNERNYQKELIPDVEFLNKLEIKRDEKCSTLNYSSPSQKEEIEENLHSKYFSNTTNTVNNATAINGGHTEEEVLKKPSKLFRKFTLKPFDSNHTKTTNNTENTSTPKISVKRNKKIKSFRELKKSIYNRLHSKSKKSTDRSNTSILSSTPSIQHEKSIVSVNKRNSMINTSLDERSFVTAPNESRLTFHYFDKLEVSKSIIIKVPEDKEKLVLTTDLIMSNLSLFHQWNLLDAYRNSLQNEIAKFVQDNGKLFDKSKKYESKVNFSDSNEVITVVASAKESSRKTSKKEKGHGSSNKLKKKRSLFNILIYGKSKSKSNTLEDHSQNHQRSYSDNKETTPKICHSLTRSSTINTATIHQSILTKSMDNISQVVPQDDKVKMGLYWLSSAANGTNNNDGPYFVAQYILGAKYEDGKQVAKNVTLSIFWLKRALEKFTEENINSVIINEAFNNDVALAKELENPQGHHRRTSSSYGIQNKFSSHNLNSRSCPVIDESIHEDVDENDHHDEESVFQSIPVALSKSIKKGIKKRGHFYSRKDKNNTSTIKEMRICNALEEEDKIPYENRTIQDDFLYRNPFAINDSNIDSSYHSKFPFNDKEFSKSNNFKNSSPNIGGHGGDDLIFSDVLTNYKISKNGDKIVKKRMSKFMNVSKNIYSTLSSPLSRSHSLKEGKYGRSNHFFIDTLSKDTSFLDRNHRDNQLKKYSSLSVIRTDLRDTKEKYSFYKHYNRSNDEFNSTIHQDGNGINGTSGFYNAFPSNLSNHRLNHRRSSIVSNINMRGPQDYEAMNNTTLGNISVNNDKEVGNYSAFLNNTSLPPPYRSRAKNGGNTSKVSKKTTTPPSDKVLKSPSHLHRSEMAKKSYHNLNKPLSEIKEATENEATEDASFCPDGEGNKDVIDETEIIQMPSPKPDQENNSLNHSHSQTRGRSRSQSINKSRSLRNKPSKRSIVYDDDDDDDSLEDEIHEHSSNYIRIKRKSQSRKEANDLILNTSTLSSKKLMSHKKKRLRSKKNGDANSSRKIIHSFSNDRISLSGELNRLSNSQRKQNSHSFTHSSFLSYLNDDSMESSFIYPQSKSKSNSYGEIYQPISSIVSYEATPQRQKLVSLLNNLVNLRITERELKKQRKREERKRLKERTSSSSTMVANDTTPLPSPPVPHPQPPLPVKTNFSKSKHSVISPVSTKSRQQILLEKNKKLAQLEAATVKGSSMLTTYSMFSLFLSSESESFRSGDLEFSNEVIRVNSQNHHQSGAKDFSKIRSVEREETSKSTLFSDSNSSWSSSSSESSFTTSTILTESSNSQPYSLVTSYLSSLSPMAEAEISSSFYSEMEDLFQLVKSKLEATTLTTVESDYYSYADIVYQLGLCYRETDPLFMVKLMYQAAVRGHAKAQYLLGRHFLLGQVIPFSLKFGVHWLTLSADQGHSDALYDLGCLYLSDYSSQYHSVEQGKSYLQLALDNGNLKAQKILNQLKKDETNKY